MPRGVFASGSTLLAASLAALALGTSVAQAAGRGPAVSSAQATAIASALPLVRSLERTHPDSFSQVTQPGRWRVAGRVLLAQSGVRAGSRQLGRRPRARDLHRHQDRLDDGARCARRLRAPRHRALHLAAAVPVVPRPVLRLARAAAPAQRRPAGADVLLDIARVLQPRRHLPVGPARLSAARLPAGAPAVAGAAGRERAGAPAAELRSARCWRSASSRWSPSASPSTSPTRT